jgi:hypothetical protein
MRWVERSSESNTILLRDFQIVQRRAKVTVLRALGCRGGRHITRPLNKAGTSASMGRTREGTTTLLLRIRCVSSPHCPFCPTVLEDTSHLFVRKHNFLFSNAPSWCDQKFHEERSHEGSIVPSYNSANMLGWTNVEANRAPATSTKRTPAEKAIAGLQSVKMLEITYLNFWLYPQWHAPLTHEEDWWGNVREARKLTPSPRQGRGRQPLIYISLLLGACL